MSYTSNVHTHRFNHSPISLRESLLTFWYRLLYFFLFFIFLMRSYWICLIFLNLLFFLNNTLYTFFHVSEQKICDIIFNSRAVSHCNLIICLLVISGIFQCCFLWELTKLFSREESKKQIPKDILYNLILWVWFWWLKSSCHLACGIWWSRLS